ncbi:MAG: 3-deoxy-D-manno-octulosonate 8-phosphate phosphatase, YrbI family [Parcubacteria group bacterium GW2011_GWC1_43_61]|uniref:3-deoxy-D-manno-octulosonate 8-phosphate phosphatase, YrbI family n=1 Tax=Candidatus Shapirobacteria bacterium GW2011_GWE1_38_92 TaxID=1618489 RepID=A0A0G0P410_9BACT|nr:MAG: 3-deoxy-D-manno-octulosonate 8-phosphate phosphatase, YrbI family [Candidatus Shapirobacteria bacterium GW2011_GWE1_38_92]KKR85381.1 MAG: 3-deoxy-D-manno-octulosonate 8-phosphate phosphatase, YrbI family [Candidatus Azambacteria bacterium GW2011_GWF1_41_10]KKS49023.1 MAG: 3-deoxy-D-manno-octulosonate 8-phosphate phosphatase, YrbI family [Candidatus Azambacteria bacterium GW2011_GWF2_42_22]KKS69137.1 MAG: 3-deoxy-D-manno-octulosonate 8-phosphate phosphatase, YrbI family [Candidatus Azamba
MDFELLEKLRKIKLLVLDCDGVLTDSYVYVNNDGNEFCRFSHRDGKGIQLIREAGIEVAIITSQKSPYVKKRCDKMGVEFHQAITNKLRNLGDMLEDKKMRFQEVCFVGDDVSDIAVMNNVGLPIAVADAEEEVKKITAYITKRKGGEHAVREVCNLILEARRCRNEF